MTSHAVTGKHTHIEAPSFEAAAILRAHRIPLAGHRLRGKRLILIFDDSNGRASELLRQFDARTLTGNIADLFDAWGWAKREIYARLSEELAPPRPPRTTGRDDGNERGPHGYFKR